MWMWVAFLAVLYLISVMGPLWTVLTALALWFVGIPLFACVITFLTFAQELDEESED